MIHKLVLGLGFGDEGKGTAVDWFCSTEDVKAVIRYNGGPQAAHNVVMPSGVHHTFAQFGSGTLRGVATYLSEHMLVNPFNLVAEADGLEVVGVADPLGLITISEDSLLVTPYHVAANRAREDMRGTGRHGSTGLGVGETRAYALRYPDDAPRIGDLLNPDVLYVKLIALLANYDRELPMAPVEYPGVLLQHYEQLMRDRPLNIVPSHYINELLDSGMCVFEGAQGVLLDENFGFHPHTTWTDTTTRNAYALLNGRPSESWGITRTYTTRHGAGPFPTEDFETGGIDLPELHNGTGEYQGSWRVGALDLTLLNYAFRATGGVDKIMVTHMDTVDKNNGWMMTTHGYGRYDLDATVPFELSQLILPYCREDQEMLTAFLSEDSSRYAKQYDLLADRADVSGAIYKATGRRPAVYSYGPTADDKVYADGVRYRSDNVSLT